MADVKPTKMASQPAAVQSESVYTVEEFAANAKKIFGTGIGPDIVNAAFMVSDVKKTTISNAKDIVKKFISKEVK